MKILLDENLPRKLKADFGSDFDVKTVRDMGWLGKTNGALLELISINNFDFFITIDKNLQHQQNLKRYNTTIFLLLSVNNRRETLQKLIEKIKDKIKTNDYIELNLISESEN